MNNPLTTIARRLAEHLHTRYCDVCLVKEARHFRPRVGGGTIGTCNECEAWRRQGRI